MKTLLIILNIFFVSFLDKPEKDVPALSPRAVEQREKWSIETDNLDYPVSQLYLDSLRTLGAKIHHTSRWMNGATVEMDDESAEKVRELSFVTNVETTRDGSGPGNFWKPKRILEKESVRKIGPGDHRIYATSDQLNIYNLTPLHSAGFEGQGIVMAVCDGGFYNADTLSCFRQSELELGHFDFTDAPYDFYGSRGSHGTECLSTISGSLDNYKGAATKAQYYLMRSEEDDTESPKEMDNLVVALETADSLGVNVFSVSLGYLYFDNSEWDLVYKDDLDGRTTRASRAATIAARKGMLVCVAAGNEGDNSSWRWIGVPADADSILTVGAVNTDGHIGSFSSYGPSADGRVKPDVCAVGVYTTLIYPDGSIIQGNGTSFATPLLAGLAACLWSALPDENAMQIRERIIRSADRYDNPTDPQYGYGIPDAWKAYTMTPQNVEQVESEEDTRARKVIDGRRILIYRHGHIYNLAGQRVQ